MEKRKYQEDIISDVLSTQDDVLVVSPTGSGKTYIAKRIAQGLSERVLFITPRIDLVAQTVEAFDNNCDILWGKYKDTGKHITVASRQTLALRENLKFPGWTVILDEVHIGLPKSKELISKLSCKRVIGLTATPERMDGLSFLKGSGSGRWKYGLFDRVIEKVTIQDLQRKGYLSKLNYSAAKYDTKLKKIKCSFDELRYSQFADKVETPEAKANLASFLRAHEDQKPFLVFTPDVDSAHYWKDEINKFGYNLAVADGSMKKDARQELYTAVKGGKYDGIVNCALLTYGFDMPCAKTIVLIRNIKSRPLYIQTIGRVLRPYEGKEAIVYDMAGTCWNFCTLDHPVLFDAPIDYKVDGFDVPPSDMKGDVEEVESLVGQDKVHEYLADPLKTLQDLLYAYKENFEISLYEATKKLQETADVQISQAQSKAEQLELDLISTEKELKRTQVALQHAGSVTEPKLWFKLPEAFNWFRFNFPRQVLRPLEYDKSRKDELFNNPEWKSKYYKTTLNELPVAITQDDVEYCIKKIDSYSHWWLDHFTLNWSPN